MFLCVFFVLYGGGIPKSFYTVLYNSSLDFSCWEKLCCFRNVPLEGTLYAGSLLLTAVFLCLCRREFALA